MLLIDTMVCLAGGARFPLNLRGTRPASLTFQGQTFWLTFTKSGVGFYTAGKA